MTPAFRSLVDSLVASGASWKPVTEVPILLADDDDETDAGTGAAAKAVVARVHTLSNVPYGSDSPLQSLDLFFSDELLLREDEQRNDHQEHGEEEEPPTNSLQQQQQPPSKKKLYPVYVHIHGGGWSRGRKDSHFYGGPAVSQNAVANAGCIAVAIGYRLGTYPEFVRDAAAALRWVRDHAEALGGDADRVVLSGHSAGGHIASLLLLRQDCFLAPLRIPPDFVRGLVLLSGVYDLFRPLRQHPLVDAKNKWFVAAYVWPAFGSDEALRREASPLLLLEPDKDTGIWGKAEQTLGQMLFRRKSSSASSAAAGALEGDNDNTASSDGKNETSAVAPFEINTSHIPPTLILNAAFDMGLQENGELMARAMRKHAQVRYRVIPKTDHASICWNPEAAREIRDFVQRIFSPDSGESRPSCFESEL